MTAKADFDIVGVGVGPANLSLAALLYPHGDVRSLFLDLKNNFSWHDGQQLPDTTLQVSIFKDLVSLADPTNEFSFLSYLHDQGRIYHFINAQFQAVPRREYRNYLEWASRRIKSVVFGEQVRSIDFDGVFVVRTDQRVVTANNVAVGVGSRPWIPPAAPDRDTCSQFHVCEFVDKAAHLAGKRVAVVGGGQSGAEAFLDLVSRPADELPSRVSWFSRRRNFLPIDDTSFTNDFFMPSYAEYFYGLDRATRDHINQQNILLSDGISEATLRAIYQRTYYHRFIADSPGLIKLYPNRTVTQVREVGPRWDMTVVNNDSPGRPHHVEADAVIWATGFRTGKSGLLAALEHRLEHDGDEYLVDRDYAIVWDGPRDRSIFVQNAVLAQRGLADKNLSLLAWRSQRIADRLRNVKREENLSSFVEWDDEGIENREPCREVSEWPPSR
ncbi:MAG TPA: SidA/IucD/PvdA family monooxygenase [Pseudonocardiaceae bacterium]